MVEISEIEKQKKAEFVENFGKLLCKYKVGDVVSLKYDYKDYGAEFVEAVFIGGATKSINITFDSLEAITRDVMKEI